MEINASKKTAILFGATGLVGGKVLQQLLEHGAYSKVICFSRRPLDIVHHKLEQYIIDFEKMKDYEELMICDDLYLCMGTTMAKAKSKKVFMKVDVLFPYHAALMARKRGANQVLLISSVGANPDSLFFYLRMKGEIEKAILKLNFWATHIFRPSLLLGERIENRFGENLAGKLGKGLNFISGGFLDKIKPVEADVVAMAMIQSAQNLTSGSFIYPSDMLQKISEKERALRKF